jgi:serine/threonine-protein phosphatase 2A activator
MEPAATSFNIASHTFAVPTKKIDDIPTLEKFKKSEAHNDLLGFISMLVGAVKRSKMKSTPMTDNLKPIHAFLETIDKWIDEIPPVQQPMRFGNKAFRTWQDRVIKVNFNYLHNFIGGGWNVGNYNTCRDGTCNS